MLSCLTVTMKPVGSQLLTCGPAEWSPIMCRVRLSVHTKWTTGVNVCLFTISLAPLDSNCVDSSHKMNLRHCPNPDFNVKH